MNKSVAPKPFASTEANSPHRGPRPINRLRPRALALALAVAGVAPNLLVPGLARAQALPGGLQVMHGQATVNTVGNRMTVTNSAGAILNWQSFSVGSGQAVTFAQPSASSKVLNRVVGTDPSNIQGSISSNGQVWLLNPYGVLFGPGARVDVGSLVVSTLNISDSDWIRQSLPLTAQAAGGGAAAIDNQGQLRTATGGSVILVAGPGGVSNEGLIDAPGGQVLLAAGKSVALADSRLPNIAVQVSAPSGSAVNLGQILASGGSIDLLAAMVNQQGIVRAGSIAGAGGQIVLRGSQGLTTGGASVTSADGSAGGRVTLDAGSGTAAIAGRIDVSGNAGSGGQVELLGRQVGLLGGSTIDASGTTGGGLVLAGGGAQGQDAAVRNAHALYMDGAATITADATVAGDGGHIVLWSDAATRAYGSLSARGGPGGGNGGLIETSGGWLDARPLSIETAAPRGKSGTWLLDPNNISIVDSGSDTNINFSGSPDFTTTGDSAVLTTATIDAALASSNNVSITTGTAYPSLEAGDITMAAANILFASPSGAAGSLTLNASRNILITASTIQTSGIGRFDITLNAGTGGLGGISISNSVISTTGGGTITLGGPTQASGPDGTSPFLGAVGYDGNATGVSIVGSQISTDTGQINIFGQAVAGSSPLNTVRGVSIGGASKVSGGDVVIRGWADSSPQADSVTTYGVYLDSTSTVTASNSVLIDGMALNSLSLPSSALEGAHIGGTVSIPDNFANPQANSALTISGATGGGGFGSGNPNHGISVNLASGAIDASGAGALTLSTSVGEIQLGDYSGGGSNSITIPNYGGAAQIVDTDTAGSIVLNGVNFYSGYGTSPLSLQANTLSGYSYADLYGSGALTFRGANFSPTGYSYWNTNGPIQVFADSVTLGNSVYFASQAGGVTTDGITVAGFSQPNVLHFDNQSGSQVFSTPNSRWLVYGTDPTDTANWNLGGLPYDATVYATLYSNGQEPAAGPYSTTGNLQVFSVAPVLSLSGSGTPSRAYDGSSAIDISSQFIGLINGDTLTGSFDTPDVGNGKPITFSLTGNPATLDSSGHPVYGYTVSGSSVLSGDVAPALLTLGPVTASDKTYDGTTAVSLSGGALGGLVNGETLNESLSGAFARKDVGSNLAVNGSASLSDGTGLASNYSLPVNTFSTTANITQAPLTVSSATASNKVYDGSTSATITAWALSGVIGSDNVGVAGGSGAFGDANAGNGKTVTATASGLNGAQAADYTLSQPSVATTANITPATLTLSGVTAANKTYDGTTVASLSGGTLNGLVGGQSLGLSLSGAFASKDAATGITVSGSAGLLDGTGLASNYQISGAGAFTTSADILPALLTLSGVSAANKTYDASTAATLSGGTLAGLVGGETLGLGLAGTFADPNAGGGKTVNATATLANNPGSGGLAANYTLGSGNAFAVTASITPAPLTLSGVTAANKTYDGTTSVSLSGGTLTGLAGAQTLGLSLSGAFASKDAGTGIAVTGDAGLVDGTGLASNYSLPVNTFSTTANITQAPLTVSSATASNKVYDGSTSATITAWALSGVIGSDNVGVAGGSGAFGDANAGNGKTVTATASGLNGAQAADYTLSQPSVATTANITPATLTLSGVTAANKTYDGTTVASLSGGTLNGLVGGQSLGLSLSGAFASKDAATGITVSGSAGLLDGTGLASNYQISGAGAFTTSADILPALLTLSGVSAANKTYDASTAATLSGGTLSGLVGSEALGLGLAGSFADPNAGGGKTVNATAKLSDEPSTGGLASNYTLGSGSAFAVTANITPAPLTLGAVTAANMVYDGTALASLSGGALIGLIGSQTLGETLSGTFTGAGGKNVGNNKSVSGSVMLADGGNGGLLSNYALSVDTFTTTANISPAPVDVTAVAVQNKVYDGSAAADVSSWTLSGLVAGDSVGVGSGSASFANANAANGKLVTATVSALSGADASNYTLTNPSVMTSANITPAPLTLGVVTATSKVYDGSTLASLSGGALIGLVGNQTLTETLSGSFTDRNAGGGKAVTGSVSVADGSNGGLVANYALVTTAFTTSATISPAPLVVSAAAAASKVYDGTTSATITGWTLSGVLGGDSVGVAAGSATFADANAGNAKTVTATATTLGGAAASNYSLAQPSVLTQADIMPATLTYAATPSVRLQGDPLGIFNGTVSGFVAGDTLAGATSGNLSFTTTAPSTSQPGQFAIDGTGLSATNYTFVQAPGNSTALTVVANSTALTVAPVPLPPPFIQTAAAVLPPTATIASVQFRLLDSVQAVQAGAEGGTTFGSIDLSLFTGPELLALIAARTQYMEDVFAEGISQLQKDPTLADAPPCQSRKDLESGVCLADGELLARLQAEQTPEEVPQNQPPATAPASPVATPAAPTLSTIPAMPAVPAGGETLAAPSSIGPIEVASLQVPGPLPRLAPKPALTAPVLPPPLPVRRAAVPQIHRKIAVLIGNDAFIDKRVPWLDNAGHDADSVAAALETRLGYQTVVIHDATRQAILGALNRLAVQARPDDSVLIYYAGHGVVVDPGGMGYWIPSDADAGQARTWVSNEDIGRMLGRIRASQVVLVSDSCFSGSLVSDRGVEQLGRDTSPAAFLAHRAALVMSSGGNEPVADGALGGHSPFAQSLLDAMDKVSLWEPGSHVFTQVRDSVSSRLPQRPRYGPARIGSHEAGGDYLFEQRQLDSPP